MAVITINPSDNPATLINAGGTGDSVVWNVSTLTEWRLTAQISPKTNMLIDGPGTDKVRLNASKLLTGWTGSGTTWQWTGSIPKPTTITNLPNTTPALLHPQAKFPGTLFRNKVIVWKAGVKDSDGTVSGDIASPAGLNPTGHPNGECFVDYQAGIVYYRGPAITGGDVMEFTNTFTAIGGGQAGWELYGLEVFGSGNRGFQPTGADVNIHDVDVHGCWVNAALIGSTNPDVTPGQEFHHSRLWDGLQYNIKGSQDLLWVHHCDIGPGDLIDFRNGGSLYYDSGQSKFTNTGTPGKPASGLRLNDNVWHDTSGHALWMDIDNINGIAQRETFRDIGGYGVHYEISYAFQVLDSLFERCRQGTYQSTAQDLLVQGCVFRGCVEWASRIVDDPSRPQTPPTSGWVPGGGAWPDHRSARGSYKNNDYWLDVAGCQVGIQGWPADAATVTATNQWDGNRYHLPNAAASVFVRNGTTGYSGWRGKGQDAAVRGARFYGPGKFTRAISLAAGQNTVSVVATDSFGNRTQKDVSIIRGADTTPPTLIVSTPPSDTTVPNSQTAQTVSGTVSDNAAVATVTVNGASVSFGTGGFSTSVALGVGQNTITVVATDTNGLTTTVVRKVTRDPSPADTIPPVVTILDPSGDVVVESNVAHDVVFSGTVSDNVGVATLTVDGAVVVPSGGSWTRTITFQPNTSRSIVVVATDAANNQGSATITVSTIPAVDRTPPALTVTNPPADATIILTPSYTQPVAGTVSDDVAVASVTVNGVAQTVTNGAYATSVALSPGQNTITVIATDTSGNTSRVTRTLVGVAPDTVPPSVTITNPGSDVSITGEQPYMLAVSGEASDDVELQTVIVNGGRAEIIGINSWLFVVPLFYGTSVITATAIDAAGNRSETSRQVTLVAPASADTTPPELVITAPAEESILLEQGGGSLFLVAGTAIDLDSGIDTVTVNGSVVGELASGGAWTFPITLTAPQTIITVIASDKAGNTTTLVRTITLDERPNEVLSSSDFSENLARFRKV